MHTSRFTCHDVHTAQQMSDAWTDDMDAAIVHHVNVTCQHLAIAPARLHPHEIYLSDEQLTDAIYAPLQGWYTKRGVGDGC